jgi:hypothetical protein
VSDLLKNFILASLAAITILILSLLFNIVRAFLSDRTTISTNNLFNINWIWNYKYYLVLIFFIGIAYFASSMFMTQFSKYLSFGQRTATFTFLIFMLWSTIFIPIHIFIYNIWRKEAVPPIFDRFWLYISTIIFLGLIVAFLAFQAINRLQELA